MCRSGWSGACRARPCSAASTARSARPEECATVATTIYGIKNCDTMKKARAWLDGHGVAAAFHDYKASGIDKASLERWVGEHGWQTVLNRAGTTFRALPDAEKQG